MSRAAEAGIHVRSPQPAPGASRRPTSLLRGPRDRELYLLRHLGVVLLLLWRLWVDPLAALRLMADVGAPAMSGRDRLAAAKEIAEFLTEPDQEPRPTPAILEAATRWFCGLRLPAGEDDVRMSRSLRGEGNFRSSTRTAPSEPPNQEQSGH